MNEELVIYLFDEFNLKLIMLIEKLIKGTCIKTIFFGYMLLKKLHFLNCYVVGKAFQVKEIKVVIKIERFDIGFPHKNLLQKNN